MDENFDFANLEPLSRAASRVLLILNESPLSGSSGLPAPETEASSNGVYQNAVYQDGIYGDAPVGEIVPEAQLEDVIVLGRVTDSGDTAEPPETASDVAHPLYRLLAPGGHELSWTTRSQWMHDISAKFDVIVVEADVNDVEKAGSSPDGAVEICHALRTGTTGRFVSILAVIPTGRRTEKTRKIVDSLHSAGVDDFFPASATAIEVESRIRAMTQLARVRSQLEEARDQLRLQLQTDDTTKLLNRRFFFQAAHRECGRARRYDSELSCLMVAIDHFKKLGETLGWESGDMILRAVAQILRDYTRDSDIVARFGDDKFVVILPETDMNGATMLREKIQNAVMEQKLMWHGHDMPLTVSIGEANRAHDASLLEGAESDEDDDSDGAPLSTREELAELLKSADAALFVAKRGVRLPTFTVEAPRTPETGLDSLQNLPSLGE